MNYRDIYNQYYAKAGKFTLAFVKDECIADDLIQETFVRIRENLVSLKDPSRISSWVFRIAYNLCQDHFRQSARSPNREDVSQEGMEISREASIQKELEQRQMGQCVQGHMSLLPESLRTVLILYDIMDFSHREIAEILGTRIENTKVRLHRARTRLKAILKEQCAFEVDERGVLVCEPTGKLVPKP
jgi:RNA polymerase sigma-70 factor (ECF subfamily)